MRESIPAAFAPPPPRARAHPPAAARRSLSRDEFAFLRGVLSGIEPARLWSRYMALEGRYDPRLAERTLRRLRDELAAIARRDARHRAARLVAMDLSRVPPDPKAPSLDEFAARFDADFYSETELQALFAEAFPPSRTHTRRARLVAQQLEALDWLEGVAATDPAPGDPVGAWLAPAMADKLETAGIATLAALVDRVNGKGLRWWSGIAGLGPMKAARILAWLAPKADAMGTPIGGHVLTPRRQLTPTPPGDQHRRTAVVPLEQFLVPAELDGSRGAFRAPKQLKLVAADTDLDAINAWLRSKRSPNTVRAYRKEAERLLLWAILVKRKPLSSMTVEDCEDYRDFLADPQPREIWCGQRGRERWGPLWRPFNGPLDANSERHAVAVLKSLYAWLAGQGYLVGNPWAGVASRLQGSPRIQAGRAFTKKQWLHIGEEVKTLPDTGANRRLGLVLALLYVTGLRRDELVRARVEDLQWQPFDDGDGGWMLSVIGKGIRLREVPVPDAIMEMIRDYLRRRGLRDDPAHPANRGAALVGRIDDALERVPGVTEPFDPREGITAGTLYEQLKAFFGLCADRLSRTSMADADRLRQASTHWLRHTHGSHAIAAGVPVEVVKENLGHTSIATTSMYVTAEKKRRHAEVARLLKQ
jgi:site-specific recombinase XerD